jgi:hypothetical protein
MLYGLVSGARSLVGSGGAGGYSMGHVDFVSSWYVLGICSTCFAALSMCVGVVADEVGSSCREFEAA